MFVSAFKQLWCWLCSFSEPPSRISPSSSSALLKLKVIDWLSVNSDLLYHHCLGPSVWAFSINLCVFRCSLFCLSGLDSAVSSLSDTGEVRFFIFEGVSVKGTKSNIKCCCSVLFFGCKRGDWSVMLLLHGFSLVSGHIPIYLKCNFVIITVWRVSG